MPKRKRVVLSMKDKYEINKRLEEGESATKLSIEYKVGKSTITDIKKQKTSISNFISQLDSSDGSSSRKTMKLASNTNLDDAVFKWFTQKRCQGEPISGPILCEKAVQFNEKLGGTSNFQASTGWLKRFKSRHGIRELQIEGEKLSADSSAAESFRMKLRDILNQENYALENVYNADETGLNWKALPRKTLASRRELAAPGPKISKDRITALACANATGSHRLPMLVIGKSKKPRCFKHVNMSAMPIVYTSQKSAWMDSTIFVEWFVETFIPSVKAHQLKNGKREKTLLLLDNAPTHPSCDILNEKDEFVKVMFLPPNVTSLLQPMDQGVIETFKRYYRKELLRKLLLEKEEDGEKSLIRNHKKIDLKDASYMIGAAWDSVKEQNLKKAWNKVLDIEGDPQIGCVNEKHEDVSEMIDMLKNLDCHECDEEQVQEWMDIDDEDPGYQIMQDSEILDLMTNKDDATTSTTSTASSDNEDENIVSASEAFTCLDIALRWFETQAESDQYQISVLKKVRDLASRKRVGLLRQTKIQDFFKR